MEIQFVVGALVAALGGVIWKLITVSFSAGLMRQRVTDLESELTRIRDDNERELERVRNRLDRFLDPQQHYEGKHGC